MLACWVLAHQLAHNNSTSSNFLGTVYTDFVYSTDFGLTIILKTVYTIFLNSNVALALALLEQLIN